MNESNRVSLTSILEELSDDSLQRLPRRMSALLSDALAKPNPDAWGFSKLDAASDEHVRSFIQVCTSNNTGLRTLESNADWPLNAILRTLPFYGILDKSGCWVVEPELEGLGSFEHGLARAKQGGCRAVWTVRAIGCFLPNSITSIMRTPPAVSSSPSRTAIGERWTCKANGSSAASSRIFNLGTAPAVKL